MELIEVNVIEIIKTNIAYENKVKPFSTYLEGVLTNIHGPTLLKIDFTGISVLDYKFVVHGFGNIIDRYKSDHNFYLVFKASFYETEEILEGLTLLLKLSNEHGSDREILTKNGHYFIIIDDSDNLEYISSLQQDDLDILKDIENQKDFTSLIIQGKFSLIPEETIQLLQQLLTHKFIYETEHVYNSIKSVALK